MHSSSEPKGSPLVGPTWEEMPGPTAPALCSDWPGAARGGHGLFVEKYCGTFSFEGMLSDTSPGLPQWAAQIIQGLLDVGSKPILLPRDPRAITRQ